MQLPCLVLLLLLAERSITSADDRLQSFASDDDPPIAAESHAATTSTAGAATIAAHHDEDEEYGDDRHHRTRMVLPLVSSLSKEDTDNPIHHHRFQHQQHRANHHASSESTVESQASSNEEITEEPGESDESIKREKRNADSLSSPETWGVTDQSTGGHETHPSEGTNSATGSAKDAKRLWGAAAAAATSATGAGSADPSVPAAAVSTGTSVSGSTSTSTSHDTGADHPLHASDNGRPTDESNKTRAFVVSKAKMAAGKFPPDGYALSARVYIDPTDRLAHFDSTGQHIPYWDCGHSGSTTSPLPLKSAYFRHSLTGATSWSGTDGKHAVLVVTLSPVAMDLNSGETREFGAGSVILLEDVLIAGHRMHPLGNTKEGVSVLFLTLPQQFVHTGKDHISLPSSFLKPAHRDDPCPNEHPLDDERHPAGFASSNDTNFPPENGVPVGGSTGHARATLETSGSRDTEVSLWTPRQVRRGLLAVFGLSLSSLAADFLAKTAPLWLAVGIGGTCFVAACTWAVATGGDALWMAVELQLERRKLGATSGDASLVLEEGGSADSLQ